MLHMFQLKILKKTIFLKNIGMESNKHSNIIEKFIILTLSCSANERTEMKLKIYLSEAWMCSEFGMLITDVERERVKYQNNLWI